MRSDVGGFFWSYIANLRGALKVNPTPFLCPMRNTNPLMRPAH